MQSSKKDLVVIARNPVMMPNGYALTNQQGGVYAYYKLRQGEFKVNIKLVTFVGYINQSQH